MVKLKKYWRDTVGRNVGHFHTRKYASARLAIKGRRSDSNRYPGSSDPEPGALIFPSDQLVRVAELL